MVIVKDDLRNSHLTSSYRQKDCLPETDPQVLGSYAAHDYHIDIRFVRIIFK